MIRGTLVFAAVLLTLPFAATPRPSGSASPEEVPTADDIAIGHIAEAWKTHYNEGDAVKVAELYTEDAYYLSAHILAHGRPAIQGYWERGIAAGGHIDSITPLQVYHSGDLGYCAGTYQATNAGVTVDGRILIVMKKVNGKWLMAAHETVVRDQP